MVAPIHIIAQKKIDVKNWRQIVEPMTQKGGLLKCQVLNQYRGHAKWSRIVSDSPNTFNISHKAGKVVSLHSNTREARAEQCNCSTHEYLNLLLNSNIPITIAAVFVSTLTWSLLRFPIF